MLVKDIMSRDIACCPQDTSLRDAAQLMVDHDCGLLPVTRLHGRTDVVGVITDRDLACRGLANGLDPEVSSVSTCMSAPARSISPEATVEDCVRLLSANRIRRLVVIDETGTCRGVVAQADVARHAPSEAIAHLLQEVSQPAVSGATVPETVGLHRGNPALDL